MERKMYMKEIKRRFSIIWNVSKTYFLLRMIIAVHWKTQAVRKSYTWLTEYLYYEYYCTHQSRSSYCGVNLRAILVVLTSRIVSGFPKYYAVITFDLLSR